LAFCLFKTISVTCLWSQGEVSSYILENADKFNFIIDAKTYIFIANISMNVEAAVLLWSTESCVAYFMQFRESLKILKLILQKHQFMTF